MTRKQIRDFVVFWEKLPDVAYPPGPEKEAWNGELRTRIGGPFPMTPWVTSSKSGADDMSSQRRIAYPAPAERMLS